MIGVPTPTIPPALSVSGEPRADDKRQLRRAGWSQPDAVALLKALRNRTFNTAGLASATDVTRLQNAYAVNYMINGRHLRKEAVDGFGAVTGLLNTGAGQFCKVRVEIDLTGAVTYTQAKRTSRQDEAPVPPRTPNRATLGWIEIPASFTFGVSSFAAAGVTIYDGDPDLDVAALEA